MSRPGSDLLRSAARRELSLGACAVPGRPPRSGRIPAAFLRVTVLLALGGGLAGVVAAQPPYRQEVVRGISSLVGGTGTQPELADLDGDGDLDLATGHFVGTLNYFRNAGSSTAPSFFELAGTDSPLDNIDPGARSTLGLADLDGDGDLDAVVGESGGPLYFFENTGGSASPAFVEATGSGNPFATIDVGTTPSPDLVDLDGDFDLDLALGDDSGLLFYFENTGTSAVPAFVARTGTANPFAALDVGDASTPDLADLDGDGDLDLTVGDYDGVVDLFLNTGTSSAPAFAAATGSANPFDGIDFGYRSAPELADLDGDGDLDAVVGDRFGGFAYLSNTGTTATAAFLAPAGTANPLVGIDIGTDSYPAFADLDGDGDRDAVVGETGGGLRFYRNTGHTSVVAFLELTGTADPTPGFTVGTRSRPELADLDGDLDLDLLVGADNGTFAYLRNTGSSGLAAFLQMTGTDNPFNGVDVGAVSAPGLADLDGDGDLDAVVGELNGTFLYFRNTGTSAVAAFVAATGTANPFPGIDVGAWSRAEIVDFDLDGDLDVASGDYLGVMHYLANTGTSTSPAFVEKFGSQNPFVDVGLGGRGSPTLVDLDGDGDLDVWSGSSGGWLEFVRARLFESVFDSGFSDDFESGDLTAWSNF